MEVSRNGYPSGADHFDGTVEDGHRHQVTQPAQAGVSRTALPNRAPVPPRGTPAGAVANRVPAAVKSHGFWLGAGIAFLPGSIQDATRYPQPVPVANAVANGLATTGELIGTFNTSHSKVLGRTTSGTLGAGAVIGVALSINSLAKNAQAFAANPQSEDAKWRLVNSGVQTGVNLAALAVTPFFPGAALVPLFVPDIGEAMHADRLHSTEQALQQGGLTTEAQAVHQRYVGAALNATPVVNWFESFYDDRIRPAIEKFEASQQNHDGDPPQGELPPAAHTDPRVVDFYGTAMRERLEQLKKGQQDWLADLARREGMDSVTLVSHAPQVFRWPESGKPMRIFDRAVVLTWSRATGSVTGTFFGPDDEGVFRLPSLNEGVAYGADKQNLVVVSDQFDEDKQPVTFDLAAYRALPARNVVFRDPNGFESGGDTA